MPRANWTAHQLRILRKEYPTIDNPRKLAKRLGKSYTALKSRVTLLKLYRKRHAGNPWTPALVRRLINLYPNRANTEIAERLGLRHGQIIQKAFKLQLYKSAEHKLKCALQSGFRPGHVPANKGKKVSPEVYAKAKATMFKKGHLPANAIGFKDGDISIRNEHPERNGGRSYKYIRVSLGKWYPLHQYKWEKKHGKLPKGHCLWFKDGNAMNCVLKNLELITRGENVKRNSGSTRLSDGLVAFYIAGRSRLDLIPEIMKNKDLIEIKRQQLLLKRTIKKYSDGKS